MKYRPELDGLRALAVLLVVLCHANLGWPGGFIGVDVFFVLSGYLMTQITINQIHQGTFGYFKFWTRRLRRLGPALLACLSCTWLAGWVFELPVDFEDLGRCIAAQLFCLSNLWYCWGTSTNYFLANNQYPVLHTWSLSLEEQFYLLFALGVMAIRKFRSSSLCLVAVFGGLSLLASGPWIWLDPKSAFYLVPFRLWQFLFGTTLLAIPPPRSSTRAELLSIVGLSLILIPAGLYSPETPFPGLAALPPTLGTALVLYGQGPGPTRLGRWLALPPLVFVGRISYSLYLWHWPLLSLAAYGRGHQPGPIVCSLLVLLAVVLAVISYFVLERPLRRGFSDLHLWLLCSTWALGLLALCNLPLLIGHPPQRFSPVLAGLLDHTRRPAERLSLRSSAAEVQSGQASRLGRTPTTRQALDFLVWGDSHAWSLAPAFDHVAQVEGLSGALIAHFSYPPLLEFHGPNTRDLNRADHAIWSRAVLQFVARRKVSKIFLVACWSTYLDLQGEDFSRTVRALRQHGTEVWLVDDVPFPDSNVPRSFAARMRLGIDGDSFTRWTLFDQRNRQMPLVPVLRQLGQTIHRLDPCPLFQQSDGTYRVFDEHGFYYVDLDHLSTRGAEVVEPLIRKALTDYR